MYVIVTQRRQVSCSATASLPVGSIGYQIAAAGIR